MPIEVRLPKLGEGVIEGTISRWLKAEGDHVEEMEPLLEVTTDKVDTEIPAPAEGTVLKILFPEGATVAVGQVVAYIGAPGEAVPEEGGAQAEVAAPQPQPAQPAPDAAASPPPPEAAPAAPPPPPEGYRPGRHPELGYISPLVAKLANEHKINLAAVKGTGLGGRITKEDVLAYLESRPAETAAPQPVAPPPAAPPTPPGPTAVPTAPPPPPPPTPAPQPQPAEAPELLPGDEIRPLSPMRRAIAAHMARSKFTAPHVVTVMEADLSKIVAHRKAHKDEFAAAGVKLTFTPYFIAAAAQALRAYPIVNTSWSDQGLIWHREVNIGMAVSLGEDGLIVPVIRHADELSLLGLARAVNDLAERARQRKLRPDEITGSTFSVTNHGVTGSILAAPIINQPNVAIMGIGAIKKRPIVVTDNLGNDSIAIRPMVYLTLTFDHRVLDGAVGDMFLGKVVEVLENWQ